MPYDKNSLSLFDQKLEVFKDELKKRIEEQIESLNTEARPSSPDIHAWSVRGYARRISKLASVLISIEGIQDTPTRFRR